MHDNRSMFVGFCGQATPMESKKRKDTEAEVLNFEVSLASGRSVVEEFPVSSTVSDLKRAAQQALGQCFLRLAGPDGQVLDEKELLGNISNRNISALVLQPKVAATKSAFALWCLGGNKIVTWGRHPNCTGVHELRSVQEVYSNGSAFAALSADGSVVTWGDPLCGGDSEHISEQLKHVQQIYSTTSAFAALLQDQSVVTWGLSERGGDSHAVGNRLRNVQRIYATDTAFAAILSDGGVVTWGDPFRGGDSTEVRDQLRHVQHIYANCSAFAASLADGSVVTWGDPDRGGDSATVQDQLRNVHPQAVVRHEKKTPRYRASDSCTILSKTCFHTSISWIHKKVNI